MAKADLIIIWLTLPPRDLSQLENMFSVMRLHLGEEVDVRCFSENECPPIALDTADATRVGGLTLESMVILAGSD